MQLRALASLLAMPPPLRHLVLEAALPTFRPRRCLSTSSSAPPTGPPSALSYRPDENTTSSAVLTSPPPATSLLSSATTLFTSPPPRFLYSVDGFRILPVNTRIPEVCLLGRSNVGKSTLINALAGIAPHKAGRSHGPRSARTGLAITSAKAGCTRTMNAYGFGPPLPRLSVPEVLGDAGAEAAAAAAAAATTVPSGAKGGSTRAQRRAKGPPVETPPRHSLVVMDLPGYGFNSQASWGVEIEKYLSRRAMLRGAVLLVDAVAGVKDGDRQALKLLAAADVRTLVVLTKADKLLLGSGWGSSSRGGREEEVGAGDEEVRRRCAQVWKELEKAAARVARGGDGPAWDRWEREIWVTGAGALDKAMAGENGGLGIEGARLAICRLAGLVEERKEEGRAVVTPQALAPASGKIVPFDQIQWGPSSTPEPVVPPVDAEVLGNAPVPEEAPISRGRSRPWKRAVSRPTAPERAAEAGNAERVAGLEALEAAAKHRQLRGTPTAPADPFNMVIREQKPRRRERGQASF
ncbi:GTP binding protein [Pleurostoma richardsiae]|uniref:GTP binding protein n=1 Tax=Pleurostoma richardsiae TaxID=41990 RepID=A0AA38VHB6_9PEZI|nr:GTP binding protein [Pleurostoma richardsiae]